MATELLQPVVDEGVRLTHFFNGRVLTAEDLRREQDAAAGRHRGLAAAAGDGVVHGLEVTPATRAFPSPTVRVSAGLAFNRDGDPVALPREVELRLTPATAEVDAEAGLFAVCEAPPLEAEITNPGFYLLAARPASTFSRDQVASVNLSSEGVATGCGSAYAELGASFRLVSLPLPAGGADAPLALRLSALAAAVSTDVETTRRGDTSDAGLPLRLAKNLSQLRSGMAYWCAGADAMGETIVSLAVPAASPTVAQPPLEALRTAGTLASCEVPLALLYVTRRQLEWVDAWAVRRPPVPRVMPDPLARVAEAAAPAESAAAFMQFRAQAAGFLASDTPLAASQVRAREWFLFLPPVGILPLAAAGVAGFDEDTFFNGISSYGGNSISKRVIPWAVRQGLPDPPVPLFADNPFVMRYSIRTETGESVDWQSRYVAFFAKYLPWWGYDEGVAS